MNNLNLKNKRAVVTGAAQGIGLAIVERLLLSGAQVSLWDIDKELLAKTAEEISSRGAIHHAVVDISSPESVATGVKATVKEFKGIDILINNAAIVGPNANLWEYPIEDWQQVIDVGLVGTFLVSRAIVPLMIEQDYGRIVNVASVAGKEGNPTASAYSSAKAGVIALAKSLGKETAQYNISVNCVTPTIANTTMAMAQSKEIIEYMLSKVPRGRFLLLEEAAAMITWMVSEENSFTTGSTFDLSGGRSTY